MFIRSMVETVKAKIKHFGLDGIKPGDILVINDAYFTSSHLNHFTLPIPSFTKARLSPSRVAWRTGYCRVQARATQTIRTRGLCLRRATLPPLPVLRTAVARLPRRA